MADSDWFEVTVYRVGESANKAPSDTFTAHTLTVRPDGNLKIEWEGGSHGFTAGGYDRFELKRVVPRCKAELSGCTTRLSQPTTVDGQTRLPNNGGCEPSRPSNTFCI